MRSRPYLTGLNPLIGQGHIPDALRQPRIRLPAEPFRSSGVGHILMEPKEFPALGLPPGFEPRECEFAQASEIDSANESIKAIV